MNYYEKSVILHREKQGKIEIVGKVDLNTKEDLSISYTPGVAEPCKEIHKNPTLARELTIKGNTIAVISDGSAVLGLGNIGAKASIPVMEGKALIFKRFAGVDAFPICIDSQDTTEIINTIKNIAPVFGGINLEDISSPRCIEIERKLESILDIPVFHDDQHGTAIVVVAALLNALKLAGKSSDSTIKIVINGAGSAGLAIAKHLIAFNMKNLVLCDSKGIITKDSNMNWAQREIIESLENYTHEKGILPDALVDADVFIGVSVANTLKPEWISKMTSKPIIFAMANPEPEILPDLAIKAGAFIVGTGRSDYPNQINNLLAFPGIFRGALDSNATKITTEMKKAATYAIAALVNINELNTNNIIPSPLDERVAGVVAKAVSDAWRGERY